jgi:hypothetical protein
MGQLDYLRGIDTKHPSAQKWHNLCAEITRRLPRSFIDNRSGGDFFHPWKTTVDRWEESEIGVFNNERKNGTAWKVMVRTGLLNDDCATILYKKKDDPRGWVMPNDYPQPVWGSPALIDRPLYEQTSIPDDPPFTYVITPEEGARNTTDWTNVSGSTSVPEVFRTEDMNDAKLFKTSVYLTADAGLGAYIGYNIPIPQKMNRYRIAIGKLPSYPTYSAKEGGWVELATLWLVRPKQSDGSYSVQDDLIYVQQKTFWNLLCLTYPIDINLGTLADLLKAQSAGAFGDPFGSIIAGMVGDTLAQINIETFQISFWTGG